MKSAKYWIEKLGLEKHPEGGWFKEIYRSSVVISENALPNNFRGNRNSSTSIYYLLEGDDFSAFHRIKSDEIWHFYAGTSSVEIVSIEDDKMVRKLLGDNSDEDQVFQFVVPKNTWFAAQIKDKSDFALVGCTVSPGFHFDDFEMADEKLLKEFPHLETQIRNLIRF